MNFQAFQVRMEADTSDDVFERDFSAYRCSPPDSLKDAGERLNHAAHLADANADTPNGFCSAARELGLALERNKPPVDVMPRLRNLRSLAAFADADTEELVAGVFTWMSKPHLVSPSPSRPVK